MFALLHSGHHLDSTNWDHDWVKSFLKQHPCLFALDFSRDISSISATSERLKVRTFGIVIALVVAWLVALLCYVAPMAC